MRPAPTRPIYVCTREEIPEAISSSRLSVRWRSGQCALTRDVISPYNPRRTWMGVTEPFRPSVKQRRAPNRSVCDSGGEGELIVVRGQVVRSSSAPRPTFLVAPRQSRPHPIHPSAHSASTPSSFA